MHSPAFHFFMAAVGLLLGIQMTLKGYGYLTPGNRDPIADDEWMRRYGRKYRNQGPILIIVACMMMLAAWMRS